MNVKDIVEIISFKHFYSTYDDFLEKIGREDLKFRWKKYAEPILSSEYEILAIGRHHSEDDTVCVITPVDSDKNEVYLIGRESLERKRSGEIEHGIIHDGRIVQYAKVHHVPKYLPKGHTGYYVRFKTKEERLTEDGVKSYNYRDGFNWNHNMDYLFGAYVPTNIPRRTRNLPAEKNTTKYISGGDWEISNKHLVVDEIRGYSPDECNFVEDLSIGEFDNIPVGTYVKVVNPLEDQDNIYKKVADKGLITKVLCVNRGFKYEYSLEKVEGSKSFGVLMYNRAELVPMKRVSEAENEEHKSSEIIFKEGDIVMIHFSDEYADSIDDPVERDDKSMDRGCISRVASVEDYSEGTRIWLEVDEGIPSTEDWLFTPEELVHVREKTEGSTDMKFKVGDQVRVIGTVEDKHTKGYDRKREDIGKITTVEDTFGDKWPYILSRVEGAEGINNHRFSENELELVTETKIEKVSHTVEDSHEEDFKLFGDTETKTQKEGKKTMKKLFAVGGVGAMALDSIKEYMVEGGNFALTPSGLAINGKVLHKGKEEYELLSVDGTQFIEDIPFGINIPTDAKDVSIGDIVFTESGEPLYIISKKGSNGKQTKLTCINPENGHEIIKYPEQDLFGNQTFAKLLTPFNYDLGVNPVMNMLAVGGKGYTEGGSDEVIKRLLPQAIKAMSQINITKMLSDKKLQYIAPGALVLYKLVKSGKIDLDKIKSKGFKIPKADKKVYALIIMLVALALYLNKDKISKFLLKEKVKTIPVLGNFASPIAGALNKIPSVRRGAFKKAFGSLVPTGGKNGITKEVTAEEDDM